MPEQRKPRKVRGGVRKRRPPAWERVIDLFERPLLAGATSESIGPVEFIIEGDDQLLADSCRILIRSQTGVPAIARQNGHDESEIPESDIAQLLRDIGAPLGLDFAVGWTAWVSGDQVGRLIPVLASSQSVLYRASPNDEPVPLRLDVGPAVECVMAIMEDDRGRFSALGGLRHGGTVRPFADASLILSGTPGAIIIDNCLLRVETYGCALAALHDLSDSPVTVPKAEMARFVRQVSGVVAPPRLLAPQEYALTLCDTIPPSGQLHLSLEGDRVSAGVSFAYGEHVVPAVRPGRLLTEPENKRQIKRDATGEAALMSQARAAVGEHGGDEAFNVPVARLGGLVRTLATAGWAVFAEGAVFRRPGAARISVRGETDWFELDAEVDYDGASIETPELLKAIRGGHGFVRLGDGSFGLLPEEWLSRQGVFSSIADIGDERLRVRRTQAVLLDELLNDVPDVRVDSDYAKVRARLRNFDGIPPGVPGSAFVGELRGYQAQGVGWLNFLDEMAWGGCLADDMGLGKTIQFLAWLTSRIERRTDEPRPSLVVAPRSVVHHWIDEAQRFAPTLKTAVYHGTNRAELLPEFDSLDLVVTTYQTLRNDIGDFVEKRFDCVVLDEAQLVKNPNSQAAKSVRRINARRRLALTGTPIENHLGDLWSLFEFLNPGMLGTLSVFEDAFKNPMPGDDSSTRIDLLRRSIRPFVLRRTKRGVAPELPERIEETIFCEMTESQSKRYAELRDYYRTALGRRLEADGLNKSRMHVLEALLRLRQAACHPALLDSQIDPADSGKIEALLPMLRELIEEGHKALVFSQFTSMLALVRKLLDAEGIAYEYLDGQTVDRRERVKRFQEDESCGLFLISLKAGGVGLNLTAADYCFLLDPWWNPAIEAQAIDRAHRIGQIRRVIAYRLVAAGTVEEKILELQGRKRELADAVISESVGGLTDLSKEDLELLLS